MQRVSSFFLFGIGILVLLGVGHLFASDPPQMGIPGRAFNPRIVGETRIPGGAFVPRNTTTVGAMRGLAEQQGWGLTDKGVNAFEAWKSTKGKGARVAIFDTGIDKTHPELVGKVIAEKDFTGSRTGTRDIVGHGTHCAGIVAMSHNDVGYVGIAPEAEIVNAKVLGDNGSGSFAWLIPAIYWAVDEQKVHIISGSLGAADNRQTPATFMPELRKSIQYAVSKGVIVIFAAGNDNDSAPFPNTNWPGRYPEVICVAASDINGNLGSFSSQGPEVDVSAPGVDIWSCLPNGQYGEWDGTSMATPVVAGTAALYVSYELAAGRTPTQAKFEVIMKDKGSVTRNPNRPNPRSGYGLIKAPPFVAKSGQPEPPPVDPDFPPPIKVISFSALDLNEAGFAKLKEIGLLDFAFDIRITPSAKLKPDPVPIPAVVPATQPRGVSPGADYSWRYRDDVGWGWVHKDVK